MSLERRLSELKQEIQYLEIEKQSRIDGINLALPAQDWPRIEKHAARLTQIDGLLIIKNNQSQQLILDIAEEQRIAAIEAI